jgi:hypothetical protein
LILKLSNSQVIEAKRLAVECQLEPELATPAPLADRAKDESSRSREFARPRIDDMQVGRPRLFDDELFRPVEEPLACGLSSGMNKALFGDTSGPELGRPQ